MKSVAKAFILMVAIVVTATAVEAKKAPESYSNPILTGYHPDPSICRVGDDFYLINSSFEWFPGIPIHKSKDLVNWELIGYAMKDKEQCYNGNRINIFAPTIRYHDGLFYIITTSVGSGGNFYITAKDPAGEWSKPTWLEGAPGIDPSIFWDDDGKCYYIGQHHANPREWLGHNDIWIQELDLEQGKLVGERKNVTSGHASNAMWTEGPHLYKIDGRYILLVAEGGTGYYHAVTIFHSENLWGPYTPDHSNPILTHRHLGIDYPVFATGHADFVDTPNGEWWMVALGKRLKDGHTYLSRETFLVPMKLEPRKPSIREERGDYQTIIVSEGKGVIPDTHPLPKLPWTPVAPVAERDEFDGEELALVWNFRCVPTSKWYSLEGGALKVNLRKEVAEKRAQNPSLLAQRIRDYEFQATTEMKFKSDKSNEQAGLTLYRNDKCYLMFTRKGGDVVLETRLQGEDKELFRAPYTSDNVVLRLVSDGTDVALYYGESVKKLTRVSATVPLTIISDLAQNFYNGPMVGIYCSSNGAESTNSATFNWFELMGNY
ncbi:MAG: glycoside hydrolase family 43 protein [Rikenellaceae bacterium]